MIRAGKECQANLINIGMVMAKTTTKIIVNMQHCFFLEDICCLRPSIKF